MKQANLSENDINNMTKQFESMFKDMSENMNFSDMSENLQDSLNNEEDNLDAENNENPEMQFGAIPLGSIFSSMLGMNDGNSMSNDDSSSGSEKKKVKVDKNQKEKSFRYIWY